LLETLQTRLRLRQERQWIRGSGFLVGRRRSRNVSVRVGGRSRRRSRFVGSGRASAHQRGQKNGSDKKGFHTINHRPTNLAQEAGPRATPSQDRMQRQSQDRVQRQSQDRMQRQARTAKPGPDATPSQDRVQRQTRTGPVILFASSPRSGREHLAQGKSAQPWERRVELVSPRSGRQKSRPSIMCGTRLSPTAWACAGPHATAPFLGLPLQTQTPRVEIPCTCGYAAHRLWRLVFRPTLAGMLDRL